MILVKYDHISIVTAKMCRISKGVSPNPSFSALLSLYCCLLPQTCTALQHRAHKCRSISYFSGVLAYDEATTEASYYQETAVQL